MDQGLLRGVVLRVIATMAHWRRHWCRHVSVGQSAMVAVGVVVVGSHGAGGLVGGGTSRLAASAPARVACSGGPSVGGVTDSWVFFGLDLLV